MLENHVEINAAPDAGALPGLPVPDPVVVESARLRLADRHGAAPRQPGAQAPNPAEAIRTPADPAEAARMPADSADAVQTPAGTAEAWPPADPADDVRAVIAVTEAASGRTANPADALDVGAGLVLLCQLRLSLDQLEADLLDTAESAGLNWDVIAAIMAIPVAAAQHRHAALRTRRDLR